MGSGQCIGDTPSNVSNHRLAGKIDRNAIFGFKQAVPLRTQNIAG